MGEGGLDFIKKKMETFCPQVLMGGGVFARDLGNLYSFFLFPGEGHNKVRARCQGTWLHGKGLLSQGVRSLLLWAPSSLTRETLVCLFPQCWTPLGAPKP